MQTIADTQFDFIVIGAGSSGSALAARLSEDPSVTVCLIEAGGKDTSPLIYIPFGISLIARFANLGWGYNTAAQKELNGRELFWPRGKTLGGSSSVNAMCYIRGAQQDYNHWQSLGADGWDWSSVLPYFIKSENQQHGASEYHGDTGPLSVNDLRHKDVLSESFVKTASDLASGPGPISQEPYCLNSSAAKI